MFQRIVKALVGPSDQDLIKENREFQEVFELLEDAPREIAESAATSAQELYQRGYRFNRGKWEKPNN